ncbi:MAG: hypothetical protein ACXAB2_09450 [Candidatus Hodarchaeales archaeon]|jgi:proteasome regulatory subunit
MGKRENEEFNDSHTRALERRIRTLETEKELLEVHRDKLKEERDNLRLELHKLKQSPLIVGILLALLDDGKALIKSYDGPIFAVGVGSFIPPDRQILGRPVLLHQKNLTIFEFIPKLPSISLEGLHEQLSEAKKAIESLLVFNEEK